MVISKENWRIPDSWKFSGKADAEPLIELPADDKGNNPKPLILKWREFLENDKYPELRRYVASFYYDKQPITMDYVSEKQWATYRRDDKRAAKKIEYEGLKEFPGDEIIREAVLKNKKYKFKDVKYDEKTGRWQLNFSNSSSGEVYNTIVWSSISISISFDLKNLKGRYFESSYIDDLS